MRSETQVTLPAQIVIAALRWRCSWAGASTTGLGRAGWGTIGGLILGLGLILAELTNTFSEGAALAWLVGTYAVLGGIGIGMADVCPIATCVSGSRTSAG